MMWYVWTKEEWSGYPAFCPQVANSEMLWDKTCTPWKFLKYYFQRVYCCISGISCCLELSESSDWDNRAYKYVRSLNDLQSLRFALECFHSTKQNDSDGLRKWDMHCQEERDNLIIFIIHSETSESSLLLCLCFPGWISHTGDPDELTHDSRPEQQGRLDRTLQGWTSRLRNTEQ